jgi:hypothetical protein
MSICGNFVKPTKRRPKNWIDRGYKIIVPFNFKWRAKLGKVQCDCTEVWEYYQPWYGYSWFHMPQCAMMRHLDRYPGITNLVEVSSLIAQTE